MNSSTKSVRRVLDCVYPYHAFDGTRLFGKARWSLFHRKTGRRVGKTFSYALPSPAGPHAWQVGKDAKPPTADRYLYHMRELFDALCDCREIFICEGEKDADLVQATWGITTTTHHQGAVGWSREQAKWFAAARRLADHNSSPIVHIAVDRDAAGAVLAWRTGAQLARWGHVPLGTVHYWRAAVHELKADVADHIAAGYGLDDLVEIPAAEMRKLAAKYGAAIQRQALRGYKNPMWGSDAHHLAEAVRRDWPNTPWSRKKAR